MHLSRSKCIFLLVALPILAFFHVVFYPFVRYDDYLLVYENPLVFTHTLGAFFHMFQSFDPELYIPLTIFSFSIEEWFLGMHAWHFHLVNLLLHSINVALVFLLFERCGMKRLAVFLAAAIFAVHPLQVETIAWVSSRKDLLAAVFFFGALLAYPPLSQRGLAWRTVCSWFLFLLSLLSKVSLLILPVILLFYVRLRTKACSDRQKFSLASFFLLSCIFGAVALVPKLHTMSLLSGVDVALLASKNIVVAIQKFLLPINLSFVHPQMSFMALQSPEFLFPAILCIALGIFLYQNRTTATGMALGFFLVTLSPTFLSFARGSGALYLTEKYLYVPLVGLCYLGGKLLSTFLITLRAGPRFLRVAAVAAVYVAFLVVAVCQSFTWRSTEAIAQKGIEVHPAWMFLYYDLGAAYEEQGRHRLALEAYERGLELHQQFREQHRIWGMELLEKGYAESARREFTLAERREHAIGIVQEAISRLHTRIAETSGQ